MLNADQLWERVRRMQGQIVYTIDRGNPNRIPRVTDDAVEIENRATSPTRDDIVRVYEALHVRGEITGRDLYGDQPILGHPYANKVGRIIIAILVKAVPDEIEAIHRDKTHRLSGIRLK